MSGIVKGIKKVGKKLVGGAKKIFKGVKKVFKKIASSTIGKIALAAVVIYTGGVLMGSWGQTGPMSGLFGAWGGTAAPAVTQAAAAPVAAGTASGASALSSVASAVPAAAQAGGSALVAAETAATGGGILSSIGNTISGTAGWIQQNPLASSMAFQGLSSALSPDEEDLLKLQEDSRKRRWSSLEGLDTLDFSLRSSGRALLDQSGKPWHERLKTTGG